VQFILTIPAPRAFLEAVEKVFVDLTLLKIRLSGGGKGFRVGKLQRKAASLKSLIKNSSYCSPFSFLFTETEDFPSLSLSR
jgi:hypothetical protein